MIKKIPWVKSLPWLLLIAVCFIVWVNIREVSDEALEDKERTVTHSWKEEVLLENNHVILVQRHQKIHIKPVENSYHEVIIHEMSIEVISDNAKNPPLKWDYPLAPLVFDYNDSIQAWYVIATWFSEAELTKVKQETEWADTDQHFPYVKFIYREKKWIKKPLVKEKLIEIPRRNIQLYDDIKQKLLTILEKQRIDHSRYQSLSEKHRRNYFCITDKIEYALGCASKQYPDKIPYQEPKYYYEKES